MAKRRCGKEWKRKQAGRGNESERKEEKRKRRKDRGKMRN